MNTRFFPPHQFLGIRNPFGFLNKFAHPRPGQSMAHHGAMAHAPPPAQMPNTLDAVEINRSLSLEESFQLTTYSRSGLFAQTNGGTGPDVQDIPSSISLSEIKKLIKKVEKFAHRLLNEFEEGFKGKDYKDLLKELILKKLTGKDGVDGDWIELDMNKRGFSLDFELDYQGLIRTKGEVSYGDLHFELHLDFEESIKRVHSQSYSDQGLRRIAPNIVDTGRYLIGFLNATSLRIFDKETSLSTTIWGDPHVDLSDVPGRLNGEFSDLKKSSIKTTFKLLDSTTVVVTAPDNGLIEGVDIFKGKDHVKGYGLDLNFPDLMDLGRVREFLKEVPGTFDEIDHETSNLADLILDSDMVYAGGDGNDWYDETGRLVWGNG